MKGSSGNVIGDPCAKDEVNEQEQRLTSSGARDSLGLEFIDGESKNSHRIHHYAQDRNVTVRLQRYKEKGKYDQKALVLEVWHTKKYLNSIKRRKVRSDYVLCTEVVQSAFLNDDVLENFGNLCHSSPVQMDGAFFKQRF